MGHERGYNWGYFQILDRRNLLKYKGLTQAFEASSGHHFYLDKLNFLLPIQWPAEGYDLSRTCPRGGLRDGVPK